MTTGQKISVALKGKEKSPEHVEKVRLANLGRKLTAEHRKHLSESHIGLKLTEETKLKLSKSTSLAHLDGRIPTLSDDARKKGREKLSLKVGHLHPRWIVDRTKLARRNMQRSCADLTWSNQVRRRDKWKCALSSCECMGKVEAHHIRSWKDNPDLRYDVDNGITLCHFHHPRKPLKATELAPTFESIVESQKGSH